jgi:DNA-binding beta-propeller fold protein YncE
VNTAVCAAFVVSVVLAGSAHVPAQTSHRYLYVAVPSSGAAVTDADHSVRFLVFDVARAHRFVRSIPLWRIEPGGDDTEMVRGTAVSVRGGRLFVSTTKRLASIDLKTGAIVWQHDYGGRCCDRFALSADGKTIYAPAFGRAQWYVVDAGSGSLRHTIAITGWPRETKYSRDGRSVYLAAWESPVLSVVDAATDEVTRTVGPFSASLCPFTVNGKGTLVYANVDGLVGFEVGDLQTGLVLDRVVADGSSDDGSGRDASQAAAAYECPSHGIAFTPDERELWIADGVTNRLRVFDASVYPPVPRTSVQLSAQPRWIAFSGDGRYAYVSTGDIVSTTTKQVAAALEDGSGVKVSSENFLEVDIVESHPNR